MRIDEHVRVAAIVRNSQGDLLAVRHGAAEAAFWTCPGGLLNVGESLSYALRRNVTFETGLQIRIGNVACLGEVTIARTGRRRIEVYFYAGVTNRSAEDATAGRRIAKWLPIARIQHDFLPSAVLAAIQENRHGEYLANMTEEHRKLPAPWTRSRRTLR